MAQYYTQSVWTAEKTRSAASNRPSRDWTPRPPELGTKTEAMLRDMATVLHLTQRVKQAIVEKKSLAETASR